MKKQKGVQRKAKTPSKGVNLANQFLGWLNQKARPNCEINFQAVKRCSFL
jgi:hypothetical protein